MQRLKTKLDEILAFVSRDILANVVVVGIIFYIRNVLVLADQAVNTVFFLGDPDETISRRAGRAMNKGSLWGCVLCQILDAIDPRHCHKAVERDDEGYNSVFSMLGRWKLDKSTLWDREDNADG